MSNTQSTETKPKANRSTSSQKALKALQEDLLNLKDELLAVKQETLGELAGLQEKNQQAIQVDLGGHDAAAAQFRAEADKLLAAFHGQLEQMLDSADHALREAVNQFRTKVATTESPVEAPKGPQAALVEKQAPKLQVLKPLQAIEKKPEAKAMPESPSKGAEAAKSAALSAKEARQQEIARLREETARKLAEYRAQRSKQHP